MTKNVFGLVLTLLAFILQGCNNDDLPQQGSRNDYEYTFEVTASEGNVLLEFLPITDGSTPMLNGSPSRFTPPLFEVNIEKGKREVYNITTKGAVEFGVKVIVQNMGSGGQWKFTEKRNGKIIRTDIHNLKGGNGNESIAYWNSTL